MLSDIFSSEYDVSSLVADVASAPAAGRHNVSLLRMARRHAPVESVDMARREMATVLRYWGYRPELWTIVGFTSPAAERLYAASPVAHPIVEVMQTPVVVRRQFLGVSERDIIARHAFMQYLAAQGLPVPTLLNRPNGTTYAMVPVVPLTDPQQASGFTYVLENVMYEIQSYMPGRRFVTDGPAEDTFLEAAARTLATLHRASFEYPGPEHHWPRERAPLALAQLYLARIAEMSRGETISRPLATGLRRLARAGTQWTRAAAANLAAHPSLPSLHTHGDYQPHNVAFEDGQVCAVYDFDATHWDRRVLELAYALLAFVGLRWEDDAALPTPAPTPPLVERGLDLERAQTFLSAYGQIAPPQPGEADLLGDALLLVLPVIFANGIAEDFVSVEGETNSFYSQRECRKHLEWVDTFPSWIEAHGTLLSDAWKQPGTPTGL
ncbi:MAG TPA: phosphotransferase [Ktedonobacterales bacterium]|nr:phosphotransferase [Ktedonobacterales bacterium]